MSIPHRIKEIRLKTKDEKGKTISGTYMAKRLGISAQYYYEIERGEKNLSAELASKIADIFNVSTDYLLGHTDNPSRSAAAIKSLFGYSISEQAEDLAKHIDEISEKDEKDIAKRMEQIKEDLKNAEGLSFSGEPMSEEAIESLLEAMEYAVRQTQRINKKYIPKKHRKGDDN